MPTQDLLNGYPVPLTLGVKHLLAGLQGVLSSQSPIVDLCMAKQVLDIDFIIVFRAWR